MAIPHRFAGETAGTKTVSTNSVDSQSAQGVSLGAEAVAVRAIARFNVERRRAGEAPLDLRGIERLRRIITEAIARGIQQDTDSADAH